jgi:DNA-binding CsgD family transcriptional regulator
MSGLGTEVTLLERDAAIAAVAATVEAARQTESSVLFLLGEAGLGKTSLFALARSAASGLSLGWAEGVAAETALPFGLLSQALQTLAPLDVLHELDNPVGLDSAQARARLYYHCTRALETLCATEPRLLLIDDLHWADPDSLGLLAFLLRRLRDKPFGVIAAMRPWPSDAPALAAQLEAAGQARIERLAPLGNYSAAQVVLRGAGGELAPAQLEHLVASCGGNPFLLVQAGAAAKAGAAWGEHAGDPGQQLVARFAGLAPRVLAVAKAASVAGIRLSPAVAGAVAEVDGSEISSALGALIRAGLARAQPDGQVEFVHPLFAQALYDSIEAPERSRLHALAMRALLALGADPAHAAAHAIAGHLAGDTVAVNTLETAGRAALSSGALHSAVKFLSAGVDLAGYLADPTLLLILAEAELAVGHGERAKEICGYLLDRSADRDTRAQALVMLARQSLGLQAEDVKQKYTEAIEAAEGTNRLVYILAEAVMVLAKSVGPRGVAGWSERLRVLSAGLPATQRTEVDLAWGTVAALAADPAGTDTIRTALGLANVASVMRTAAPAAFPFMLAAAFDSRLFVEQFEEADELFNVTWDVAERQGAILHMRLLAVIQAAGNWWRGYIAISRRMLEEIAAIETEGGYPTHGAHRAILTAMIALEEGDAPKAGSECAEAEELLRSGNPWARTQLWRVEAELALDAGRIAEAAQLGRHMRDLADRLGLLEPCWTPWADTAMIAFLSAGLLDEAQALVEHLDGVTERVPCRWPRSVAESGRAGLAEAEGDPQRAEEHYDRAVELLEGIDLPLRRARALLSYGRFLRRAGRPVRARAPLARALEESEACGGMRLASQARAELQAAGGRRRRVDSAELSAQERNVVRMAAQGSTNGEIAISLFISVKTVEHHLTSAYLKLGVHSRKDLRARWKSQELPQRS